MRALRLLAVTAMVAAALVLAPAATAQSLPEVTVTAGPAITEGEKALFRFELSEPATSDLRVEYELEEIERVQQGANSDLVPDPTEGSRTVTFLQGRTAVGVIILTTADGVHEDSQARDGRTNPLTVTIQEGAGYTVGDPSSATVQVGDDEADWGTVEWESTDVAVAEGDGHVELALSLSKPYSYPLTLHLAAFVDSANAGDDFDISSITGEVTIPALSRRVPLRVGIVDDDEPEDAETFGVEVAAIAQPVAVGQSTATVTIAESDLVAVPTAVTSCAVWCVEWSAATLAEGESVTMAIRDPRGTVVDRDELAVTLHIGRTEGTADTDDIVVRDHTQPGASLRAHPFAANKHHQGGWVYVHGFLPYGEAEVRAMVLEALDDLDDADSETLATWVYVNGDLAGAQVLTITEVSEAS